MEFAQLQYLEAIAECSSVSAAAKSLYMSQPALSKQLKKLEQELGAPMFVHGNRKAVLSPEGRIVLRHTKNILREIDSMKRMLNRDSTAAETLRIGSSGTFVERYLLPKITPNFPSVFTSLAVQSEDELLNGLVKSNLDIVFSSKPFLESSLCNIHFFTYSICLSVPADHPFAARKSISVSELEGCTFLRPMHLGKPGTQFFASLKRQGVTLNIIEQGDSVVYNQMKHTTKALFAAPFGETIPGRRKVPVIGDQMQIPCYLVLCADKLATLSGFISELYSALSEALANQEI